MSETSRPASMMLIFCGIIIIAHIWGAIAPSHYNWGVHFFAFYPWWVGMGAAIICFALFVPGIRETILSLLRKLTGTVSRSNIWILFLMLSAVLIAIANIFSAQSHLLGDSMLILKLTPTNPETADVSANFRNQPLTYFTFTILQRIMGGGNPVDTEQVYSVIGMIGGVLSLGAIFWFLSFMETSALNKFLIGCFFVFNARSQFFFGYVENYILLSVFTFIFLICGWLALEDKISPIIPALCIALMIGFHISAVVFLPSFGIILLFTWKKHKVETVILAGLAIVAGITVAGVTGYGFDKIIQRAADAVQYDFLPWFTPEPGIPYGIFSLPHAIDWVNAVAHLVLFGSGITLIILTTQPKEVPWKKPVFVFLAATAVISTAFSLIFNPALGMARDWDLMATFLIALRFLAVYLLLPFLPKKEFIPVLVVIVIVMILRSGAWIGINADPDRHLQRAEMLTEPSLSGTFPKVYYENLAVTCFGRKEYLRAAKWYERYIEIDSVNPRIIGNLSEVYRKAGDTEKVFEMLKRSARVESHNPGVYSNLGVEYALRKDTVSAIASLNRALEIDSNNASAHANLSMIYSIQRKFLLATQHSEKAIALGLHRPSIFQYAGYNSLYSGDYAKALKYFDQYLTLMPSDIKTKRARDRARAYLEKTTTSQHR